MEWNEIKQIKYLKKKKKTTPRSSSHHSSLLRCCEYEHLTKTNFLYLCVYKWVDFISFEPIFIHMMMIFLTTATHKNRFWFRFDSIDQPSSSSSTSEECKLKVTWTQIEMWFIKWYILVIFKHKSVVVIITNFKVAINAHECLLSFSLFTFVFCD